MANHNALDTVFHAIADPTRRAVIARLGRGPAPVKELAAPHDMALPSFLKHLDRLERAGLVTSRKRGRTRVCTLRPEAFQAADAWIEGQKRLWHLRTDRLAALAEAMEALPDDTPDSGPHG